MQQFTVPQFIDVEDKIIGPLTTRQFIIMLVAFMIVVVSYKLCDFTLFVLIMILTFGIAGVFAFLKVNGRPFHLFVINFIQTTKKAKLRVWNNDLNVKLDLKETESRESVGQTNQTILIQKRPYIRSRLSELSLIVDTQGAYKGEEKVEKIEKVDINQNLEIKS